MDCCLVIIGVNFGNAPESMRERFRVGEANCHDALHSLVRSEGVDEAIVLCNAVRTEFIVWASDPALAANSVLRFLTREFDLKLSEWSSFYRLVDEAALLHVMHVAAGLDSPNDTEPEITKDLARAYEKAQLAGTTGGCLDAVVERAVWFAQYALEQNLSVSMAEQAVVLEVAQLRNRLQAGQLVPMVAALRGRLDEICRQELSKLADEFGPFTEDQQQALKKLAAHITQRISGSLARELKDLPDSAEQDALAVVVQRLFRLELEPTRSRVATQVPEESPQPERVDVH